MNNSTTPNVINVDPEVLQERAERKARLIKSSNDYTQTLINQSNRIEQGNFNDDEVEFLKQMTNPEECYGTVYDSSSKSPIVGEHAMGINPATIQLNNNSYQPEKPPIQYYGGQPIQQPQYYGGQPIQQPQYYGGYQRQQYPQYQQPIGYVAQPYNSVTGVQYDPQAIQAARQLMTPPTQAQQYYPQQMQTSSYYNPNMYYNNYYNQQYNQNPASYLTHEEYLEYINEIEERKKRECNTNIGLAKAFRKMAIIGGFEPNETEEEYEEKLQKQFGYKTPAQIAVEQEEARRKMIENSTHTSSSMYDNRGYRYERSTLKVGITENGVTRVMTPEPNENGERIIAYTRTDDQMIKYSNDHFYDPYIEEYNKAFAYKYAMQNMIENMNRFFPNSLTWEECVGPEAKMGDYYEKLVVTPSANALQAKLLGNRWKRDSWDDKFYSSGMRPVVDASTMPHAFCGNYDLAKEIHDMNLSKTPEEMCLDQNLTNKLQTAFEQRREEFIDRIRKGNVRTNVGTSQINNNIIAHESLRVNDDQPVQPRPEIVHVIDDVPPVGNIKPIKRTIIENYQPTPEEMERLKNAPVVSFEVPEGVDPEMIPF